MSTLDLRDRLMPRLHVVTAPEREEAKATASPMLLVEGDDRITLTAPVSEVATFERLFVKLSGRFVEAEKANRNGAMWSTGDLEFGVKTVAGGPLNWLHEERKIVGAITGARMVTREAAADGVGAHIVADATMWRWLYPEETRVVERASDERKLWYSMECISPEVECAGQGGCGAKVPYLDALRRTEAACAHMRERSAMRRFVNPIFQGGAIIVPPVTPGWASADLAVQRQAASYLETDETSAALISGLAEADAVAMVQQVLEYARGPVA